MQEIQVHPKPHKFMAVPIRGKTIFAVVNSSSKCILLYSVDVFSGFSYILNHLKSYIN